MRVTKDMGNNATNQGKKLLKGSKMKKLIVTSTLIATLITINIANAQGFTPKKQAQLQANGTLKQAVDQMVASIEKSLGIFDGLNRTQQETMAEFDNILAQIKYSIAVTAKDGTLSKKIAGAISLANRQAQWCKKVGRSKNNPVIAEKYNKLGMLASDKATRIEKNAQIVQSMNSELADLVPVIEEEKDFYYNAQVIGELETANESLKDVHRNMKKVIDMLKQLKGIGDEFNTPAPVLAKQ